MNIDKNTGLLVIGGQSGNSGGGGGGGDTPPPATSGTEFYKCAAVYGPRKVECYVVSGCPDTGANGTYMPTEYTTGDYEGNKHTVYSNNNGWYYYYNSTDWRWNIGRDYGGSWSYYQEGSYWYDLDWMAVSGMTGMKDTITLDADVPKTWDGHKAILADGVYDFEKTLTTGLSYGSALTPVVGSTYSADASIKAVLWLKPLYTIDGNTVAYISFDDGTPTDLAGHLTNNEKGTEGNGFNNNGWSFNGGYVQIAPNGNEFAFGTNDFTFEAYIYPVNTERQCIFAYENDGVFAVTFSYGGSADLGVFYSGDWNNHVMSNNALTLNQWHHVAFVRNSGELSLWINGEKQNTTLDLSGTNVGEAGQKFSIGRWGGDPSDFNKRWQGNMDEVRISNTARYE